MRLNGDEARRWLSRGAQLVDVRSGPEFQEDGIADAINIPLPLLQKYLELLDRKRPVIVYCRSGNRSNQAVNILYAAGFQRVYDLGARRNF